MNILFGQKKAQGRRALTCLSVAAGLMGVESAMGAPQIGTVFTIAMENHNWTAPSNDQSPQQLYNNSAAPYINSLVNPLSPNSAQISYATRYLSSGTGVHPSETNYIWSEVGTNYNPSTSTILTTDADPSSGAKNIFTNIPHLTSQMNARGVTWKTYQEDYQITNNSTPTGGSAQVSKSGTSSTVTNPYYNTKQYNYAVKHNPMAFFNDTASQTQKFSSFDQFRADLAANTLSGGNPNPTNNFAKYNWITPNQYNDMHSSLGTNFTYNGTTYTQNDQQAIAQGDSFLSIIIPQLMATQAYKNNRAIIIWMDETESNGANGNIADDANHTIMEIVISPLAKGGAYASTVEMSHSSDIKTMEEIFQLQSTLNNVIQPSTVFKGSTSNSVAGANDLSDLFQAGVIPTSVVPEPASVGLLGLATLGLLARRRKNMPLRKVILS